jgi:hypothetical protein
VLSRSCIQLVFQQAALDTAVEEGDASAGAQADFFGQVRIAREDIAGVAAAFFLLEGLDGCDYEKTPLVF